MHFNLSARHARNMHTIKKSLAESEASGEDKDCCPSKAKELGSARSFPSQRLL